MRGWQRLILVLVAGGLLLSSCRVETATITQAPTDPLPATVPVLPFANNPDPTLCGIPEPDGRQGIVTGEYEGKLVQPIVYLYNSHLMNAITGQVYPGTHVKIELSQTNPTLNFYFVKTTGVEPAQSGWLPAPFLSIERSN
jgi:hypothetical protein